MCCNATRVTREFARARAPTNPPLKKLGRTSIALGMKFPREHSAEEQPLSRLALLEEQRSLRRGIASHLLFPLLARSFPHPSVVRPGGEAARACEASRCIRETRERRDEAAASTMTKIELHRRAGGRCMGDPMHGDRRRSETVVTTLPQRF